MATKQSIPDGQPPDRFAEPAIGPAKPDPLARNDASTQISIMSQFSVRLTSGLSSEKVGMAMSNGSPSSLTMR